MPTVWLSPSGNATESSSGFLSTNNYTDIDTCEVNQSQSFDANDNQTNANDITSNGFVTWQLSDFTDTLDTVTSAILYIRVELPNYAGDSCNYQFTFNCGSSGIFINVNQSESAEQWHSGAHGSPGSLDAADLNAANVTLAQSSFGQDMGPDGGYCRIVEIGAEIVYTKPGAWVQRPRRVSVIT